jgi:hypothetical protein
MSTNVQSGLTSITGNVTTNVTLAGNVPTIKLKVLTGSGAGGETLGTVGGSKTWYIIGYTIACDTGWATSAHMSYVIYANGVAIAGVVANCGPTNAIDHSQLSFCAPLGCYIGDPLTAGQVITTACNENWDVRVMIYYIEV